VDADPVMSVRVAVVVGQFPALSETFVLNQVTGLLDRGAEVRVLAADRVPQATMHPVVHSYGLLKRTSYGSLREPAKWRRRLAVAKLLGGSLLRHAPHPARMRRALRHGRDDAAAALRFRSVQLGDRSFDAVLCHFGAHGQWGMSMRNMGQVSGRLVTVFHGYDMSRYLRDEGEAVYNRLFAEGDLFLPVTEYWRRRLVELGCPADRTLVHRMGVELGDFNFVERRIPDTGPLQLLSVARLTEKKGLEYGIRAVASLVAAIPGIRYDIAGSGPLQPELERLIAELGVHQHVQLLGPLPRPEVARRMANAHILLAPSVTARDGNQEGLPVVLMEALATGLPAISTRHTGIPELIEHGVTGMLADERNVEQLAEAIRQLYENPSLHARIMAAGRRRVEAEHDIDRLNDRLLTLLAGHTTHAS
jgi:colanic acid/amylovoran biosynthesis glycosyltransferase